MGVKVDFHTHILPGVDDGSKSVEQSIEMLLQEKQQGIETVVLTPHFYAQSDNPQRFLSRRQQAYEKLIAAAETIDGLPQLKLGAEVYYFNGISDWEGLCDLAIEGTNFVLVEMPFTKWNDRMYDELDGIYRKRGLVPIVAHIDRYINVFTANRVMNQLRELNLLVQANAEFFIDSKMRKLALKLLKNNDINIIGSDCHNLTDRAPNISAAQQIILSAVGEECIKQVNQTENKILSKLKL